MEGLIFLSLLLVVAVLLAVAAQHRKPIPQGIIEKFEPLVIPKPGPPPQPIGAGEKAKPYNPPSAEILVAPYGETSDVTSRPFQDPALDKAPYDRIYQLLQDLNAFHDFEVEKLQDKSDPQIALPLATFRGDRQRLMDEVAFLNRNPGLQSSLTVLDIQGVRVNLTYLQKRARALEDGTIDASAVQLEGFEDPSTPVVAPKATVDELKEANLRTTAEIARLQASGTTDPVFQVRINTLTKISQQLQTMIDQLNAKTLLPADVPITSKELQDFLPALGDPSKPINKMLDSLSAPKGLSNLFPSYEGGDVKASELANSIFKNYGDSIFKGLSWDLNLKYTSSNALAKAKAEAQAIQQARSAQEFKLGGNTPARGAFDQAIQDLQQNSWVQVPGSVRPVLPTPNVGKMDWRERSSQICEAVRRQGLDPADFGCLANPSKVGQDFSWRGYAKMVCSRLQTTLDSGLPEACGCPPVGWKGWRQ
jgi:hypothetical protein